MISALSGLLGVSGVSGFKGAPDDDISAEILLYLESRGVSKQVLEEIRKQQKIAEAQQLIQLWGRSGSNQTERFLEEYTNRVLESIEGALDAEKENSEQQEQSDIMSDTPNIDPKDAEVIKAQNDARFAEVLFEVRSVSKDISALTAKVDSKPTLTAVVITIFGVVSAGFAAILGVLAFAGDRFDGGMSARDGFNDQLEEVETLSRENAEQLNELLRIIQEQQDP